MEHILSERFVFQTLPIHIFGMGCKADRPLVHFQIFTFRWRLELPPTTAAGRATTLECIEVFQNAEMSKWQLLVIHINRVSNYYGCPKASFQNKKSHMVVIKIRGHCPVIRTEQNQEVSWHNRAVCMPPDNGTFCRPTNHILFPSSKDTFKLVLTAWPWTRSARWRRQSPGGVLAPLLPASSPLPAGLFLSFCSTLWHQPEETHKMIKCFNKKTTFFILSHP